MVHSSQAAGDLQLALRGGGDRGGRVGGRQAGLAGEVPARGARLKGGRNEGGDLSGEQHFHANGGLVAP